MDIKVEQLLEKYRVSSKPLKFSFGKEGRDELSSLIYEITREESIRYSHKLVDFGLINIKFLTPREQFVLKRRFLEKKTYDDIAKSMSVTRERIKQIEAKALERVKSLTTEKSD